MCDNKNSACCDNGHDLIVYYGDRCPLCDERKKYETTLKVLEEIINLAEYGLEVDE